MFKSIRKFISNLFKKKPTYAWKNPHYNTEFNPPELESVSWTKLTNKEGDELIEHNSKIVGVVTKEKPKVVKKIKKKVIPKEIKGMYGSQKIPAKKVTKKKTKLKAVPNKKKVTKKKVSKKKVSNRAKPQ